MKAVNDKLNTYNYFHLGNSLIYRIVSFKQTTEMQLLTIHDINDFVTCQLLI